MKSAGVALLAMLWAGAAAAQMYKCVDARGVVHYADQPTPGCSNAAVDIRPSPPISGRLAPRPESTAEQEADFRRRSLERADAERAELAERAARERRCASLRAERAALATARRLIEADARGEEVVVDDATRARRLGDLQAALAQCP